MAAYMIILVKMHDREKFVAEYGKAVPPIVARYGGEYLIVAPGATMLEGTLEGYTSVAVSKWPSREAAEAFWNSDEYAEAKELREGLADAQVFLVDTP